LSFGTRVNESLGLDLHPSGYAFVKSTEFRGVGQLVTS